MWKTAIFKSSTDTLCYFDYALSLCPAILLISIKSIWRNYALKRKIPRKLPIKMCMTYYFVCNLSWLTNNDVESHFKHIRQSHSFHCTCSCYWIKLYPFQRQLWIIKSVLNIYDVYVFKCVWIKPQVVLRK